MWINNKSKNVRSTRTLYQAYFIHIEPQQAIFQLKLKYLSGAGQFIKTGKELYFKGKFKNILFKTECIFHDVKNNTILLKYPKKLSLEENRKVERKVLNHGEYKTVDILNPNYQMNKIFSSKAQILDYSDIGMGLGLHPQDDLTWEDNDVLEITSFDGRLLKQPLRARVEYSTQYYLYDTKRIRIGLSFFNPISIDQYLNEVEY